MKKTLTIIATVIGALIAVVYLYSRANTQFPQFHHSDADGAFSAVYPFDKGRIDLGNGLKFRIDTGSSVSTITPDDVRRLIDMGLPVDSGWFPSLGRNDANELFIATERYRVSLPVFRHKYVADSLGRGGHLEAVRPMAYTIDNLYFLPADPGFESTIGSDILEKFILQYNFKHSSLALLDRVPDGFQPLTSLRSDLSLSDLLGCGRRYYMNMTVNDDSNDFFLDTSYNRATIKLPEGDTILAHDRLQPTFIYSSRGTFRAKYLAGAWARIGDRAGSHPVFYGNDGDVAYSFNPINFFTQDIVLDFPNRTVFLRPTAEVTDIERTSSTDDSALADL